MEESFVKEDNQVNEENWKIPQSNENKIIITSNSNSCTFSKDAYIDEYLSGIIAPDDFNEIVTQSSKVMIECWKENRINEIVNTPPILQKLSIISSISVISYIVLTIIGLNVDTNYLLYLYSSFGIMFIGSLILLFIGYLNFRRDFNKTKTFNQLLKSHLDTYFKKLNTTFSGLLNFNFVPIANYIECKILKRFDRGNEQDVAKMKRRQQLLMKRKKEIENREKEKEEKMKLENMSAKRSVGSRGKSNSRRKSDTFSKKDKSSVNISTNKDKSIRSRKSKEN
jgi:hypothetical protein